MAFENWLAFCSIALLATATPAPAALLVSTNSLLVGVKKSLFTILGNITGLLVMSALSVLGLSAILARRAGKGTQGRLSKKLASKMVGSTFIGAGVYLATTSE